MKVCIIRRGFPGSTEPGLKALDLVRGQGAVRFESGAYALVREHFGPDRNTAIGQEMKLSTWF